MSIGGVRRLVKRDSVRGRVSACRSKSIHGAAVTTSEPAAQLDIAVTHEASRYSEASPSGQFGYESGWVRLVQSPTVLGPPTLRDQRPGLQGGHRTKENMDSMDRPQAPP
jgi:hypothetical protein